MNNDKQNTDTGCVTIVGFGPGNPELLTLAAVRALNGADVIFYDALIPAEYLDAYPAEKIFVGKRSGRHSAEQNEINRLIACAAQKGRRVVRLHGGDAMLFGRAGEEINYNFAGSETAGGRFREARQDRRRSHWSQDRRECRPQCRARTGRGSMMIPALQCLYVR